MCYAELKNSPSSHMETQAAYIIRFINQHYERNELSINERMVLESLTDLQKQPLIEEITTFRLCQAIEYCPENDAYLIVTRYLEANPLTRHITLKKTVKCVPEFQHLEYYMKRYAKMYKLE